MTSPDRVLKPLVSSRSLLTSSPSRASIGSPTTSRIESGSINLTEVVTKMKDKDKGLTLRDKKYFLKVYAKCFTGVEAVTWLVDNAVVANRKDAEKVGQALLTRHYIHHVSYKHHFEDKYIFFKFADESASPEDIEEPFADHPDLLQHGELDLSRLFKMMIGLNNGVPVRDRKKHFRTYQACFSGTECITWLCDKFKMSRHTALDIGIKLMADCYISHVTESYPFADQEFFYRFNYEMADLFNQRSNMRRISLGISLTALWIHQDGKPFKQGWVDVSMKVNGKFTKAHVWATLDCEQLMMYYDEQCTKNFARVLLQEIVKMHRTPIQSSFTITTMLHNKILLVDKEERCLAEWELAINAFKHPNHFSGSSIDQDEKEALLKYLFVTGHKGGLLKRSDGLEWEYDPSGVLRSLFDERKYSWNGQDLILIEQPRDLRGRSKSVRPDLTNSVDRKVEGAREPPEVGKWNGVRVALLDGETTEVHPNLSYVLYQDVFQNQDPTLNWTFTRHFLASTDPALYWVVDGDVPKPLVMLVQLIAYRDEIGQNMPVF